MTFERCSDGSTRRVDGVNVEEHETASTTIPQSATAIQRFMADSLLREVLVLQGSTPVWTRSRVLLRLGAHQT
jgi:hypothetical protein